MKVVKKQIFIDAEQWAPERDGVALTQHVLSHQGCVLTAVCMANHYDIVSGLADPHLHTANGQVLLGEGVWVLRDPNDGDTWPITEELFYKNYDIAEHSVASGGDERFG